MIAIENVAPGEAIVTVLAFIGLIITLVNVGEAMRDLMIGMRNVGGELIPVVAWNNVRNEMLMATILSVYLIVGIVGLLTPPNDSLQATVSSVLSPVLFIGAEMLIVANSFANRRDRALLKRHPIIEPAPGVMPAAYPAYPHIGDAPKPGTGRGLETKSGGYGDLNP